jgi:hypothetical protein
MSDIDLSPIISIAVSAIIGMIFLMILASIDANTADMVGGGKLGNALESVKSGAVTAIYLAGGVGIVTMIAWIFGLLPNNGSAR